MRAAVCLSIVCASTLLSVVAEAANRTVCASGCQYTSLQQAIDAASPGDTILLRAGQTFIGNFILRNKNTTSTQFITIRSDTADGNLPAAGVRLIPEGKPGANVLRSRLARLLGPGGTGKSTPVVRTESGAHHYRLMFLEIDGTANVGYESLVGFGSGGQTTLSSVPYSLVVDRVWLHGHPVKGMKRGIYMNSRSTDVLNSYFDDFFSFSDSQAISGTNGPGPYRIVNNHLEAAAENIMFGGDDPRITNLVPSDIEIRANYLTKDLRWRNTILSAPGKPSASASSTAGSLSGGTHYFKVVAMITAGGGWGYSAPSPETAVAVSAGKSVTLSWTKVANADRYRIYRGTTSNGQSRYIDASGTQTSFTYTGSGELSATPRTTGTKWTVKNLLELKNAQRVTINGNVFEDN
jgi:YD repeat-containing protein